MGMLRYPSTPFAVYSFCMQGIAIESVRLFGADDDGEGAISVRFRRSMAIGALLVVGVALSLVVAFRRSALRTAGRFIPYKCLREGGSAATRLLIPTGFWSPMGFKNRYGSLMGRWTEGKDWFTYINITRPLVVAVIASIRASKGPACTMQFVSLGVLSMLYAVATVLVRPNRVGSQDVLSAFVSLLTGFVVMTPGIPSLSWLLPPLVTVVTMLSIVTAAATVAMLLWEQFKLKPREMKAQGIEDEDAAFEKWRDEQDDAADGKEGSRGILSLPLLAGLTGAVTDMEDADDGITKKKSRKKKESKITAAEAAAEAAKAKRAKQPGAAKLAELAKANPLLAAMARLEQLAPKGSDAKR